jgi:hypothetical protein
MTRFRTAAAVLLVVLGAGLLIRVTNRAGVPSGNPATVPQEIRPDQSQPVTETVDLRNGNLHVEIPIRAARRVPHTSRTLRCVGLCATRTCRDHCYSPRGISHESLTVSHG